MRGFTVYTLMGNERRQFEELFLPLLDAAHNLARWIVRDEQDTEDVVRHAGASNGCLLIVKAGEAVNDL